MALVAGRAPAGPFDRQISRMVPHLVLSLCMSSHGRNPLPFTGGEIAVAPTCVKLDRIDFQATNNITEYKGLLASLRVASALGICLLLVHGDSQLVVKQVSKEYPTSDKTMTAYLVEVKKLEKKFVRLEVRYI
ncbi:uncharacterized protein LOC133917847 [Phragmites australis]|uniref:uncharacterized protein LOC133917847 n=1 Tax=Phragmites australis TaxID=29695 RepID=UPI002D78588E|nr:uncharacterized protein LOC133917847 [Phragmites australis]